MKKKRKKKNKTAQQVFDAFRIPCKKRKAETCSKFGATCCLVMCEEMAFYKMVDEQCSTSKDSA